MNQTEAIQIFNTLIAESFPELRSERIWLRFVSGKQYDFYMAFQWLIIGYRITIEEEIMNFSRLAFKGCLAHELAHAAIYSKMPFKKRLWYHCSMQVNDKTEERQADILAVSKGFGDALAQFHKEHEKEYEAFNEKEGLTKREIKKLLK